MNAGDIRLLNSDKNRRGFKKAIGYAAIPVIGMMIAVYPVRFLLKYFLKLCVYFAGFSPFGFEIFKYKLGDSSDTLYLAINMIFYVIIVLLPFLIFMLAARRKFTDIISLEKPKPLKLIGAVFISIFLGRIGTIISVFIQLFMESAGQSIPDINFGMPKTPFNMLIYFVSLAVMPAICEEFGYRGVVMGETKNYNTMFAVFFSAFCFALMHGTIQQIPMAFFVGASMAYFSIKYNSIWYGIIIHFINNGISAMLTIITTGNEIAGNTLSFLWFFGVIIIGPVCFIILCFNENLKLPRADKHMAFSKCLKLTLSNPVFYILMFTFVFDFCYRLGWLDRWTGWLP